MALRHDKEEHHYCVSHHEYDYEPGYLCVSFVRREAANKERNADFCDADAGDVEELGDPADLVVIPSR